MASVNSSALSGLSVPFNVSASLDLAGDLAISAWKHPIVFGFRRIFVLVSPSETSWENIQDVPNYITQGTVQGYPWNVIVLAMSMLLMGDSLFKVLESGTDAKPGKRRRWFLWFIRQALPFFIALIILEFIIAKLQNKKTLQLNDSISSFSAGVFSLLPHLVMRPIEVVGYLYLFKNFHLLDLPWDHPLTWWFAFVGVDLAYYWVHRCGHEINFMWAAHQTHHSSEYYNLTTALRQSVLARFSSWIFYMPLAIVGCPPSLFLVHTHFNLLYQFWIHTEVISTLGPLEYILNTPSHHRVHHGRNRYCIDKNYGGTLIIWDRLFDTFAAESDEVAYGLVHPLCSWDAIYIQLCHWQWMFSCAWNNEGILNKIKVFVYGPGWEPGKPRMGLIEDIPDIKAPQPVYDKSLPWGWTLYAYVHLTFTLIGYVKLATGHIALTPAAVFLATLFLLWTLTNIGYIYEYKWYAPYSEVLRCLVYMAFDFAMCGFSDSCSDLMYIPRCIFMFSVSLWLLNIVKIIFDDQKDITKKVD